MDPFIETNVKSGGGVGVSVEGGRKHIISCFISSLLSLTHISHVGRWRRVSFSAQGQKMVCRRRIDSSSEDMKRDCGSCKVADEGIITSNYRHTQDPSTRWRLRMWEIAEKSWEKWTLEKFYFSSLCWLISSVLGTRRWGKTTGEIHFQFQSCAENFYLIVRRRQTLGAASERESWKNWKINKTKGKKSFAIQRNLHSASHWTHIPA